MGCSCVGGVRNGSVVTTATSGRHDGAAGARGHGKSRTVLAVTQDSAYLEGNPSSGQGLHAPVADADGAVVIKDAHMPTGRRVVPRLQPVENNALVQMRRQLSAESNASSNMQVGVSSASQSCCLPSSPRRDAQESAVPGAPGHDEGMNGHRGPGQGGVSSGRSCGPHAVLDCQVLPAAAEAR